MWTPLPICRQCGYRHTSVRLVSEPCTFAIICHGCEASLVVDVTSDDLAIQRGVDGQEGRYPFHVAGVPAAARFGTLRDD